MTIKKKITKSWKFIIENLRNKKGRTTSKEIAIQEPKVSSSAAEKVSEDTVETTIEQQVVTAKTTTAKDENIKEVHEVCKYSVTNKDTTHAIDKATETDTKLCNINSEDLQLISERSKEVQNDSTTVEPTSVDRETNEQEPNPAEIELCFITDEKDKPLTQQRQAIMAGVVGAVLLVNCVALYIMKMPVVAAVVGIVGLACIGFALYNIQHQARESERCRTICSSSFEDNINKIISSIRTSMVYTFNKWSNFNSKLIKNLCKKKS